MKEINEKVDIKQPWFTQVIIDDLEEELEIVKAAGEYSRQLLNKNTPPQQTKERPLKDWKELVFVTSAKK